MANQKALIGVLIVGGGIAAYMMTKDKTPTTPELAPAGGVPSYTDENGNGNGDDDYTGYGDDDDYIVPTASYLKECEALWDSDGERALNVWNYVGAGTKKEYQGDSKDIEGYAFRVYTDKSAYLPGETVRVLVKKQVFNTDGYDQWESHANSKGWGWGSTDPNQEIEQRLSIRNTTNDTELNDTGWGSSDQTRSGSWGTSGLQESLVGGVADDIKKNVHAESYKKDKWGVNYFDVVLPSVNAQAVGSYSIYFAMDTYDRPNYNKTFTNAFDVYPKQCGNPPPAEAAAEGVDKMRLEYTPDVHILPITSINSWQTHF